jgi:hypothetical protein
MLFSHIPQDAMLGLFYMIIGFNVVAYVILRLNKRKYTQITKAD